MSTTWLEINYNSSRTRISSISVLKPYIDLSNRLRTETSNAKNDFGTDLYKLMNNSVYGKTMENIDKRVDVRITTQWEREDKKIAQAT